MGVSPGIPSSQASDEHGEGDRCRGYLENTFLTVANYVFFTPRAAVLGPHLPKAAESEHLGMKGTQASACKLAHEVGCGHNFENRCSSYLVC